MSEIYIDISKPYPTSEEVFSHELNKNSSKHLTVALYEENEPFDLTNYGVTATFVCNGYLVAEDVGVTNKHDNLFTIDISSTNTYTILPGLMLIEFKITSGAAELYSVTAMQVKVVPSIRDNAQVTPESYGTVSEILQEVAEARGIFNNIDGRFDDIEVNVESVTQTANNLDTEVTNARGTYTNVDARFDADEAQISDLRQTISSKQIHREATVSDLDDSTFKSYIDAKTLYFLKFTGSAATALGGHVSGIMTVIPSSRTTVKREIVFPTSTNEKYVQNVTLGTHNTYSAWNKVQTIDLNTVPKITVWDYNTSETNNFTVPTSFEGKLGDIVVITTGSGSGGKKFELVKTVTNSGITSYYWEELVTYDHIPKNLFRVADFQTISTVAALNALNFLNVNTVYPIKLTGSAAAAFEVDSGTVAEMYTLLGVDEMYRYIVFPDNHIKLKQTITGPVEGVYTFGTWETVKVEADDLNAEIKAKVQSALTITGTDVFLTLAAMDSPIYIDNMYKRRIIKLSGTAASDLDVENNTYAEMYSLLVATKTWKRFIIILGSNIKFEQDITKSNSDVYSFSEWERAQSVTVDIGDGAIIRDKLSAALKNVVDKSLLVENTQDISAVSTLNGADFISIHSEYLLLIWRAAATSFGVPSGTLAKMKVYQNNDGSDPNVISLLRKITFPGILDLAWSQSIVNTYGTSTLNYGAWEKVYTQSPITVSNGTTVALEDNTEYAGTNINSLTLTYPDDEFECYLTLSFASSGTITVIFPSSSYIGAVPEFDNGETWEISIKNGVVVAAKAVSYEEET